MYVITSDQRDSRTSADLVPAALSAVATHAPGASRSRPSGPRATRCRSRSPTPRRCSRSSSTSRGPAGGVSAWASATSRPRCRTASALPGARRSSTRATPWTAPRRPRHGSRSPRRRVGRMPRRWCASSSSCAIAAPPKAGRCYDLLAEGITQREAAARLGISEAAVSLRVRSAGLRTEEAAVPALDPRARRPRSGRRARLTPWSPRTCSSSPCSRSSCSSPCAERSCSWSSASASRPTSRSSSRVCSWCCACSP